MTDKAEQKSAQFQRKTILIKKGLQYRYMALIFASVLAGFIVIWLDVIWTIADVVNKHPMMQSMLGELGDMAPMFAIKMLMFLGIVLIVSLVVSHRMAGPIFKFEKSCDTVAEGDLTHRVYLRQGDHLMDLQEHFNNMVSAMHEAVKEMEKFRADASAAGMKDKADALDAKMREIMPKFKI